jgi:tetratricopeptide (TPR) repeat protein
VRWLCFVALSLAASTALARPAPRARAEDRSSDFWRDVIEPHGEAVTAIVTKARTAIDKLGEGGDADWAVDRRVRSLGNVYGMLRYAHKLSPENTDVLGLLGHAADELGKTRQAVDALEACVRIQGPERAGSEVTGRLGTIYLRMGKLDDAVRWLRYAQGPLAVSSNAAVAAVTVHLATALAARGEMSSAIDVLRSSLPTQAGVFFTDPVTLVSFALAVQYDRDEQPGAAFEILDRMQSALQQELGPFVQRALAELRHAPAEEAYYYQALLYEALGNYTEARTEWLLYAGVPDAMWRRRALDHVRAIDELRAAGGAVHTRAVP